MKRLARDSWVTTVHRPKDEQYLYMPNPTMIHPESSKLKHALALVDLYIELGCPAVYQVEPNICETYRPDVYMRNPHPIIVEVQRSTVSKKKMQQKVDGFVQSYYLKQHDAKELWFISTVEYNVEIPSGFVLKQFVK